MNIRIHRLHPSLILATLVCLSCPLLSDAETKKRAPVNNSSRAPLSIPVGTWTYSQRSNQAMVTAKFDSTITISADGKARYGATNVIQYNPGYTIGETSTAGGLAPAKLVGRTGFRWTTASYPHKVKRLGDELYIYMTGKEQMISSDPPGLTSKDINAVTEMGARHLKQKSTTEQTYVVDVFKIRGTNLVLNGMVYQRVGAR